MPIFHKIWRQFAQPIKPGTVEIVAQRFRQVFLDHGVESPQIPRLLPEIKLENLQSQEKLLAALTPEILDKTAQLFGIRSQWLEGVDDEIYEYLSCYKQPEQLLEQLATFKMDPKQSRRFSFRVLTTTKKLDPNSSSAQLLAPVLVEQIAQLGDDTIYRYHIYRDEFDWRYAPARIELKALARVVWMVFHTVVPLFVVSKEVMQGIFAGELIPTKYLKGGLVTNPSLEDYALTMKESGVAKEVEELPDVLRYIEEHQLQNFSFSRPEIVPAVAEPPASPEDFSVHPEAQVKPKQPGKRSKTQTDVWEPCVYAAKTLWAENAQLTIAEVIGRIKNMKSLTAHNLTESAIRKHIAAHAPPGIRGKPGRKPKQSP